MEESKIGKLTYNSVDFDWLINCIKMLQCSTGNTTALFFNGGL